jgi:hypothetical protein
MDWRINLGVVVLGILLVISIAAVLLFLVLPLALRPRSRGNQSAIGTIAVLYFVAIGLGYIMAEITFIQRFVLFLGHPTYALTVVVFLMLLSSGAGSLAARRLGMGRSRLLIALIVVSAVLLEYRFLLPGLLASQVGLSFALKLAISAALLAPLGFFMGMPFPAALTALKVRSAGASDSGIEWAWAMNAASSVLGSVVAMVVAIHYGLNTTLMSAAAAYMLAGAIAASALQPGMRTSRQT